jgi:hypothetical protein
MSDDEVQQLADAIENAHAAVSAEEVLGAAR